MNISVNLFPNNVPQGREYEIISSITINGGRLLENYYRDHKTNKFANWFLDDKKGNPLYFEENDCEWLSPTFIRNKDELYGFSLIEKGRSTKLFLTKVKTQVDFESFKALGRFYAKDKNNFYYGPGGKRIKENDLTLFFDETYKEEWKALYPDRNVPLEIKLWNSEIAVTKEKVYWNGSLKKDIHTSIKRIGYLFWADNYSVFEYNLQRLKKLEGFDRDTLIYKNLIKNGSIVSLVTDINKPVYCYSDNRVPNKKYDFKRFAPLFEELRGTISNNYWWYKMEQGL